MPKSRITNCSLALMVVAALAVCLNLVSTTYAQELTQRSVTVSSAQTSVVARHTFRFDFASMSSNGSVSFEYCDNSPLLAYACHAPAGLNVSSAVLSNQTNNTGFTIDSADTTANKIIITRTPSVPLTGNNSYTFDNITNPSTQNQTEFIRITTYPTTDASGAYTDNGSVAFATSAGLVVGAYVPPYLRFCVGLTVAHNCSDAEGNSIDFGVLSASHANSAQSQFATGTNSPTGYVVYALGTTMTSGNNTIAALGSPRPNFPGTQQFGINLRANTNPGVGQEPSGIGTGAPTASYGQPNLFMFADGDAIANSDLPTDFNRISVAYLVNVAADQPPGIYSTTITYLATAQF